MKSNNFFKRYCRCLFGASFVLFIALVSCRTDFDYPISAGGNLRFSKDTVFLDTIFSSISSSTYSLKVYNDSDTDIQIPLIKLEDEESNFRINVDGVAGNSFENTPLLAKDSLFVFIESTYPSEDLNTTEFLLEDALQFYGSETVQEIPLITLVKDAVFLYPEELSEGVSETINLGTDSEGNEITIEGFYLEDSELQFTNEKPYVIYGYAAVPEGKTLTMDAGARVHFHKNAGLIVSNGASLMVNGQLSEDQMLLENEVVFEGDRLEPEYSDIAGQWGTIWFMPGSTNNTLENLTIRNATVGLFCEGQESSNTLDFQLNNVQVYNSSVVNLWAKTANLYAENSVFGSAGQSSVYLNLGGSYEFLHCSIANYWTSSFRSSPALLIDNFVEINGNGFSSDLTQANFGNCIIDGNASVELLFSKTDESLFNFRFDHCSIQFETSGSDFIENPLYDFSDTSLYENIFLNISVDFKDPKNNDFNLTETSEAIGIGDPRLSLQVPFDILGHSRSERSDLGAYHFLEHNL